MPLNYLNEILLELYLEQCLTHDRVPSTASICPVKDYTRKFPLKEEGQFAQK